MATRRRETARRVASGPACPAEIVDAIVARLNTGIRDRELPGGTILDPDSLAGRWNTSAANVVQALARLHEAGAILREDGGWRVRADRPTRPREILARAQPLFVAMARMAAENGNPAEAAAVSAARDQFAGLSGDATAQARADSYRELLKLVAKATHSDFLKQSVDRLLAEADGMILPIVKRDMRLFPASGPDQDLARLCRALMQGDVESAAAAMEDHLLIVGCHIQALSG